MQADYPAVRGFLRVESLEEDPEDQTNVFS